MEPDRKNDFIIKLNRQQKKRKKTETHSIQKKTTAGEEEDFFNTVSAILGHLVIKKNMSTVSPLGGHFCIRFSREEEVVTVSPLPGPLSSASPPAAMPWIPPVLCHLYLAQ